MSPETVGRRKAHAMFPVHRVLQDRLWHSPSPLHAWEPAEGLPSSLLLMEAEPLSLGGLWAVQAEKGVTRVPLCSYVMPLAQLFVPSA